MFRRVAIAPRHYFKHSVAILSCKPLVLRSSSVQLRWDTVATTSHQYSSAQYASEQDARAKRSLDSGKSHDSSAPPSYTHSDSPEYLANVFITFLEYYGQNTELALQSLNSGPFMFSSIHKILKNHITLRRVANILAASEYPISCIRLLGLSVAYGCRLNGPIYESVCWTLSQHKRYTLVLEVCRLAKASLGVVTGRLLDWRLRANCELENFVVVDAMLRDYEDAGVKPSRRTWHAILTAHIRNHNLAGARQCLMSMEQAGFPTDHTTHALIAANYRRLGFDTQVRDFAVSALIPLSPSSRTFVVNRLLQTHLLFDDELGFQQLLSLFDSSAIGPLQKFAARGDDKDLPIPLPGTPITVSPDYYTFLIGVRFCIARSRPDIAEEIFSFMGEHGFEPSPAILTSFLELQFALGRSDFAKSIASLFLTSHKSANLHYRLQKCELEHGWRWPFATSRINPAIDPFNALMRGLLATLGLGAARTVLELMDWANVKPNSYTIKILVGHLIRSEKANTPFVLRMLRQLSPLLRPSPHHLHGIMARLLRDEKARLSSLQRVIRSGSPLTYHDIECVMTDPVAGLRFKRSLTRSNLSNSLWQSLKSRDIRGDATMLGLRMRYEGVIKCDASAIVDIYNGMLARGITPLAHHVAALMEAFTLRGETSKALEIMDTAKIKPNVVMYTILFQGYAYQGQPKTAAELFQSMIANGIQPDVRAVHALCNAFILVRQLGAARKLLLELWPYVEPLPQGYAGLPLRELLEDFRSLDSPRQNVVISDRIRLHDRIRLRRDVTKIVKKYKHVAGLPAKHLSSSSAVRQLAKKSVHVNWRM